MVGVIVIFVVAEGKQSQLLDNNSNPSVVLDYKSLVLLLSVVVMRDLTCNPVPCIVTGEVNGTVHHLQGHIEARSILLLEAVLGHRQEALQAGPCFSNMFPGI